jgi:hypothetical protein
MREWEREKWRGNKVGQNKNKRKEKDKNERKYERRVKRGK